MRGMLGTKMIILTSTEAAEVKFDIVLPAGATYKFMLIDMNTFVPLCGAYEVPKLRA